MARAGTYEVAVCHDPPTGFTEPTDGVSFPTSGAFVDAGVYGGCAAGGYLFATLDGVTAHAPSEWRPGSFRRRRGRRSRQRRPTGRSTPGRARRMRPRSTPSTPSPRVARAAPWPPARSPTGARRSARGPLSEFSAANLLGFGGLTGIAAIEGTASCAGGLSCAAGGGGDLSGARGRSLHREQPPVRDGRHARPTTRPRQPAT